MRSAYAAGSELEAKAQLVTLSRELDKTRPGAAGSLREGLDETLTVLRLGVPPTLARNIKRWRGGQMALRWCTAGTAEARASSAGSTAPPPAQLAAELERVTASSVVVDPQNEAVKAA